MSALKQFSGMYSYLVILFHFQKHFSHVVHCCSTQFHTVSSMLRFSYGVTNLTFVQSLVRVAQAHT